MASLNEYPQLSHAVANRSTPTVVLESILLALLILLAFVGNVIVCAAVLKTPRLRTIPNVLVINLAVSDILMSVVCMPLSLCVLISGKWPFDAAVCDLQGFLMFSFGIVSQVNMAVIAVNRYFAVCRPFSCKLIFTKQNVLVIVALLWSLPSIASVPPLAGWGFYAFNAAKGFCIYPFNVNLIYTTIVQLLFIAFPMGLIAFSYTKCFITLKVSNQQVARMVENQPQIIQASRRAREIRATWTMMFATLGFTLCWSPVSVIDFIDTFTGGGNLPRQVYMLNGVLIFTSSTINPFIYWVTNEDFRRAFRQILPGFGRNMVIVVEPSQTRSTTGATSHVHE